MYDEFFLEYYFQEFELFWNFKYSGYGVVSLLRVVARVLLGGH